MEADATGTRTPRPVIDESPDKSAPLTLRSTLAHVPRASDLHLLRNLAEALPAYVTFVMYPKVETSRNVEIQGKEPDVGLWAAWADSWSTSLF